MYGPCDDRLLTPAHDVQRRRSGLHVVDELSRRNGNPVSEFITREGGTINTSGLVGQFTLPSAAGTPVLTVDEVGPGDDERRTVGQLRPRRAEHRDRRRVERDARRSAAGRPDGRHVRRHAEVLSAHVFAADGVTPVPGKGPLVQGTDYTLAYSGAACELTLTMLTAASVIGAGERLIIAYRTQLDADTQNGVTLTNVAGATQWFNGDEHEPDRVGYTRTLTDGTVGHRSTTRTPTPSRPSARRAVRDEGGRRC